MAARQNEVRQIRCKKNGLSEIAAGIETVVEDQLAGLVCLHISLRRSFEILNVVVAHVIISPELDQRDAGVRQAHAAECRIEVGKRDRQGPVRLIKDPIGSQLLEGFGRIDAVHKYFWSLLARPVRRQGASNRSAGW